MADISSMTQTELGTDANETKASSPTKPIQIAKHDSINSTQMKEH